MTPKGKKITAVVVSLLAIGGAVTYFLWSKKKGPFKPKDNVPVLPPVTETIIKYVNTPSGGSSGGGSGGGSTQQEQPSDILDFQKWVINKKGDKTILGGGGSTGFGDDGKWGSKTQKAWAKYKEDYKSSSDSTKNYALYKKAWDSAKSKGAKTFFYTRLLTPDPDDKYDGKKREYLTSTGAQYTAPNTPLVGEALIGKVVYPNGSYANVRDDSRVDNSGSDNTFIGQINSPNAIGKVTNFTFGADGKRWYYIKSLSTPLMESTHGLWYANVEQKSGWVRADSIKPILG
jgi:hypothetical protein